MTVGNYNLNHIWLQLGKYQHQLRTLIVVVLALYLLAFIADVTWRLVPAPKVSTDISTSQSTRVIAGAQSSNNQTANLNKVKNLNLFGNINEKEETKPVEVTNAPKTNLNLTLSGVVASSDKNVAAAIIENKGAQNTYGINDKIEGTNAFLHSVFVDRVIIRNGSRQETLMMEGIDFNSPQQRTKNTEPTINGRVTPSRPNQLRGEVAEASRELRRRPMGFTDYIAISPHRVENELLGYKIRPGRKPELFAAAGFQAGDVVTEINGLNLADPRQSIEAMKTLRTAKSLDLTINRGGETLSLNLEFPSTEEDT